MVKLKSKSKLIIVMLNLFQHLRLDPETSSG